MPHDLRSAWSRSAGIFDLAAVICLTDVVNGIVAPTFSLYARSLGASLGMIGILAAVVGAARVVGAVPAGVLSDRFSRRAVIATGICLFGAACALFTVSRLPVLLIFPRVLFGLAIVSTFPIGVAYIADRLDGHRRDVAISVYVSAQGLGYAVGPLLGGVVSARLGYADTYLLAAVLAAITAMWAWLRLDRPPVIHFSTPRRTLDLRAAAAAVTQPSLLGVSTANLGMMLMFSASVIPFLALEAVALRLTHLQIALLYSARAAASTIARVPAGLAARWLSNRALVLFSVALDIGAALTIGFAMNGIVLAGAVVADGVAFGTFLSASQSYVAERFRRENVGAALGAYSMAGSIGETGGAAVMGIVASQLGTQAVFRVAGALMFVGLIATVGALRRADRITAERASEPAEPRP